MTSSSRRARVAVVIVVLFAATSNVRWIQKAVSGFDPWSRDEVSRYEDRLAPLRTQLPPHAVVGYLSDPEPEGLSRSESREHYKKFLLTKYSLVPVLVVRSTAPDLVVGDFHEPSSADRAHSLGLEPIAEFKDGVVLFRKRAQ